MAKRFYSLIESLFLGLGQEYSFFICTCIIMANALTSTILAIFLRGYSLKKRLWYFICVLITFLFQLCSILFNRVDLASACLVLFFGVLLGLPSFAIREKKCSTRAERDFIDMIDGEIAKQPLDELDFDKEKENFSPLPMQNVAYKCTEKENEKINKKDIELDFSHVKNVMQKMEYYKLSSTDKKQLKDLENAVFSAENGLLNQEIKNRINDGLGALLKIMAKHGV